MILYTLLEEVWWPVEKSSQQKKNTWVHHYSVLARYTKCINLHTMSFYLTVPYNNRASLDFKSKFNLPKNIKWQAENRIGWRILEPDEQHYFIFHEQNTHLHDNMISSTFGFISALICHNNEARRAASEYIIKSDMEKKPIPKSTSSMILFTLLRRILSSLHEHSIKGWTQIHIYPHLINIICILFLCICFSNQNDLNF